MNLYLDGVLTPWPRDIRIEVDPAGETTPGIRIVTVGGILTLAADVPSEGVNLDGTPMRDTCCLNITGENGGGIVLRGGAERQPSPEEQKQMAEMMDRLHAGEAGYPITGGAA